MRTVIGVVIGGSSIRAVGVRRGRTEWAAEVAVDGDDTHAALGRVLAGVHRRGLRSLRVLVGPARCQLKRISGLPPSTDAHALRLLVQEVADRFFLRDRGVLRISAVGVEAPGCVWAAAVSEELVLAIESACDRIGARLEVIAPAITVLAANRTVEEPPFEMVDWPVRAVLTVRSGIPSSLQRHRYPAAAPPDPAPIPEDNAAPGNPDLRFADALTAAKPAGRIAFALGGREFRSAIRGPSWTRARGAVAAFLLSVIFASGSPGLSARLDASRTEARLAGLAGDWASAASSVAELNRLDGAAAEIEDYVASRHSRTMLLGRLAAALPSGASIIELRVDTGHALVTIVAPSAAALLAGLDSVDAFGHPELVGSVTRDRYGPEPVERITVRLDAGNSRTGTDRP